MRYLNGEPTSYFQQRTNLELSIQHPGSGKLRLLETTKNITNLTNEMNANGLSC